MMAAGSRRARTAAARLTAAHESLGAGSTRMFAAGTAGSCLAISAAQAGPVTRIDAVGSRQRSEPVHGGLQERPVGAGQRVEELG